MVQRKKSTTDRVRHIRTDELNKYPISALKPTPSMGQFYLSGEIRILTPTEYSRIMKAIPKDEYKTIFKVMMITGMRYVELQRLYDHPEWYVDVDVNGEDRNIINLPASAQLKHKQKQKKRTITPLPSEFSDTFKLFTKGPRPPTVQSWDENMKRWAELADINPYGMSAKTTRKTLESWCLAAGGDMMKFCLRQGHTSLVSLNHYSGLAFSNNEIRDIKEQLQAWNLCK